MSILSIIGLCAGFIGSIVLAFSFTSMISMLSLLASISELAGATGGAGTATGQIEHMAQSKRICTICTWFGVGLIASGFALQLIPLICKLGTF